MFEKFIVKLRKLRRNHSPPEEVLHWIPVGIVRKIDSANSNNIIQIITQKI